MCELMWGLDFYAIILRRTTMHKLHEYCLLVRMMHRHSVWTSVSGCTASPPLRHLFIQINFVTTKQDPPLSINSINSMYCVIAYNSRLGSRIQHLAFAHTGNSHVQRRLCSGGPISGSRLLSRCRWFCRGASRSGHHGLINSFHRSCAEQLTSAAAQAQHALCRRLVSKRVPKAPATVSIALSGKQMTTFLHIGIAPDSSNYTSRHNLRAAWSTMFLLPR